MGETGRMGTMLGLLRGILGIIFAGVVVGCGSGTVDLDYGMHPELPMTAGIKLTRAAVSVPPVRKLVVWGNYGGPGNRGGEPVDAMDELFRRHDIRYLEALTLGEALEADRELLEALEGLDAGEIGAGGERYRRRVRGYFLTPVSRVVGKPMALLLKTRKVPVIRDSRGSREGK